ncbi:GPP34 family phosphoprotein [bacterium]|nr:MAG: GPP34 family phosphoprotein [bacterium]
MELSILEKVALIALDDDTGKWVTDSMRLNYALAGGVLFQLAKKNKIEIVDGKVNLLDSNITDDILLNEAIKILEKIGNKKAVNVIYKFARLTRSSKDEIVKGLMAKGILKEQEDKILFIFPKTHYPMIDGTLENAIKAELNKIVYEGKEVEDEDNLFLLNILISCGLEKEVFGKDVNKKELSNRIKEITSDDKVGRATFEAIKQMQSAMTVLIMTSTMGAVTSGR